MSRAQFVFQSRNINVTKPFRPPTKVSSFKAWLRAARKAIPQIPDPECSDWYIFQEDASLERVAFELHNPIAERCYVTIERKSLLS